MPEWFPCPVCEQATEHRPASPPVMSSAGLRCMFRCATCGNVVGAVHDQVTGAEWETCDRPRPRVARRVSLRG